MGPSYHFLVLLRQNTDWRQLQVPEMSPQADLGHSALCREQGDNVVKPHLGQISSAKVQYCQPNLDFSLMVSAHHHLLALESHQGSTSLNTCDPSL